MKNIYLISQHNLGVGHLNRCSVLSSALANGIKDHKVNIWQISCGQEVRIINKEKNVNFIQLPALTIKNINSTRLTSLCGQNKKNVDNERVKIIKNLFKRNIPDIFITEFFPFSPYRLKGTLLPILKYIKKHWPSCYIICSSRDIPISFRETINRNKIRHISRIFNAYYDLVLIHSDEKIQSIKNINKFKNLKINCRILYTGYVTKTSRVKINNRARKNRILTTTGGGRDGYRIINAAINAAELMPYFKFYLVCGPFMPEEEKNKIKKSSASLKNVKVNDYVTNLKNKLKNYDLVICASGYNTLIETINNQRRCISIPRKKSYEQLERAKGFAKIKLLSLIYESDLSGKILSRKIKQLLNKSLPKCNSIDLDGTKNTVIAISKRLNKKI